MRIILIICVALYSTLSFSQGSENPKTAYISDKLMTYLHSGPGMNYRITGRVFAGHQVTLLKEKENGFTQIKTHQGKSGWVESQFVTLQKTLRYQVDALLKDKKHVSDVARKAQASATQYQAELNEARQKLQSQLTAITAELDIVRTKYNTAENNLIAAERALNLLQGNLRGSLWQQGAGIVSFSFLIGFIFAFFLRPKLGKKSQRWMP